MKPRRRTRPPLDVPAHLTTRADRLTWLALQDPGHEEHSPVHMILADREARGALTIQQRLTTQKNSKETS